MATTTRPTTTKTRRGRGRRDEEDRHDRCSRHLASSSSELCTRKHIHELWYVAKGVESHLRQRQTTEIMNDVRRDYHRQIVEDN